MLGPRPPTKYSMLGFYGGKGLEGVVKNFCLACATSSGSCPQLYSLVQILGKGVGRGCQELLSESYSPKWAGLPQAE